MALSRLSIDLAANIARFESDMNRAARISKRQTDRMRKDMERFAVRAGQVLGTVLATGLITSTKAAADFEKAMAEVSTLLDDTSSLDTLTDSVKSLAVEFGRAPTDQAAALYDIISAGADTSAEAIELLTAANKLAVGGLTSVETAADGLTSVLNAYAGTGLDAERVTDVMFETMRRGKTTIGELSGNIGKVATIASEAGVSFEELSASIATITVGGIRTTEAITGMRAVMNALLQQTDKTKNAAKELGIEFTVQRLEAVGFVGVLQDIVGSSKFTQERLSALVGSVEALTPILAQVRGEGKLFKDNLEGMEGAAGAAETALAKMLDTTRSDADRAAAAFQVLSINIGQTFLTSVSDAAISFVENFKKIEKAILIVIGAIKILVNTVLASVNVLLGLGDVIVQTFDFVIDSILESLTVTNNIAARLLKFDFSGAVAEAERSMGRFSDIFTEAGKDSAHAVGFIAESLAEIPKSVTDVLDELVAWEQANRDAQASVEDLAKPISDFVSDIFGLGDGLEEVQVKGKRLSFEFENLKDAVKASKPELMAIAKLWDEVAEALDDVIEEQGRYEQSLKDMIDTAFPVQALVKEFEQRVRDLDRAFREGKIGPEEYQIILNHLSDALGEAAAASQKAADDIVTNAERMKEAALESTRQMTQAFLGMWQDIISGGEDAFDGLLSGFEAMLAQIVHSVSTAKIGEELQNALDDVEGNVDFKNLADGIATALGIAIGSELGGGGQGADIGASIGGAIGSIWGPIGSAIGALLGGLAGGLFDRDPLLTIGGEGFQQREGQAQITTPLGEITSFRARGGVGGFSDQGMFGQQVGQAIEQFDQAIFDVLDAIGGDEQLETIRNALANWGDTWEKGAVNIENILGSRFEAILATFEADIQSFVGMASDFEEQVKRFDIAVRAQNLFEEIPELFPDRTLDDFLGVVDALATGTTTIEEAFSQVLDVITRFANVQAFLQDFTASDLATDFQAIIDAQNRSIAESLAAANTALFDAIANFDGSLEQFEQIGSLVATVREGEIAYLTQLDSLQKGLNANLDTLRDEILGLTAGPQTAQDLISEAGNLIAQVRQATSAEDVAALQQEFSNLIRAIDPEDAAFRQIDILNLIDTFQSVANQSIEQFRTDALSNAENMRDAVERVLSEVADPLALIAATNERAAQALESIAGTTSTEPFTPDIITETPVEPAGQETQESQIAETNRIMEGGLNEIALVLQRNNPELAAAIADAIRQITIQPVIVQNSESSVNI